MTHAEQGQERWTICRTCGYIWADDGCHCAADNPDPIEVVPASELEMCQTYFPFMRRSRDEAVRKLSACQEELARLRREAKIDVVSAEDRALTAEAARDELARAIEEWKSWAQRNGLGSGDERLIAALERLPREERH